MDSIKKLKEGIYDEVIKDISENYSTELWNMLEDNDIIVESLYVTEPFNFLKNEIYGIYVETDKINFTYKVKDAFEELETTIQNIMKEIEKKERE